MNKSMLVFVCCIFTDVDTTGWHQQRGASGSRGLHLSLSKSIEMIGGRGGEANPHHPLSGKQYADWLILQAPPPHSHPLWWQNKQINNSADSWKPQMSLWDRLRTLVPLFCWTSRYHQRLLLLGCWTRHSSFTMELKDFCVTGEYDLLSPQRWVHWASAWNRPQVQIQTF